MYYLASIVIDTVFTPLALLHQCLQRCSFLSKYDVVGTKQRGIICDLFAYHLHYSKCAREVLLNRLREPDSLSDRCLLSTVWVFVLLQFGVNTRLELHVH
jgi:hypothetical protein